MISIPKPQEKAIGVQAEFGGEKGIAVTENALLAAEGYDDNQKHRKHTQQGKYSENTQQEHIGTRADGINPFFFMNDSR